MGDYRCHEKETSHTFHAKPQRRCSRQNNPPVHKRPEWDRALDVFGYTGIRKFERAPRRDAAREKGETDERSREIYIQLLKNGTPGHKIASRKRKVLLKVRHNTTQR